MTDKIKVEFLRLNGYVLLLRHSEAALVPAIGTSMTFDHVRIDKENRWSEPLVWVVTDVRHVYKDGYLEKVLVICRRWTEADQNERYNEREIADENLMIKLGMFLGRA